MTDSAGRLGPDVAAIRDAVIGDGSPVPGPFGARPLVYADYVASGRSLSFIEEAIRREVLPSYGNTHTETSFTGRRTTRLREMARDAVRRAVGADERHAVIFTGTGATAAADKLVRALGCRAAGGELRGVVFVGPYEHHSNDLPWREAPLDLVRIPLDSRGMICQDSLARALEAHAAAPLKIGAFSAASNVTGVKTDVAAVARLLHRHGALFVCDYAAAGPYVPIRMKESAPGAGDRIDAAFLSPHKFVGGPGASGILVADRSLLAGPRPTVSGGGTVSYVTHDRHAYVSDPERREEAGTPGIVENIRAGMVLQLKADIGAEEIEARETRLADRLRAAWQAIPEIEILGPREAPTVGIFAFNVRVGEKLLHHNLVVAMLNDLFGIQARGGCSCAGPYGHELLGIGDATARAHERAVARGLSAFRPGWARLGVNYFFAEETVDYIADAVAFVARRGADLLPLYRLDAAGGIWRVVAPVAAEPPAIGSLSALMAPGDAAPLAPAPDFAACLAEAGRIADEAAGRLGEEVRFDEEAEALRWFWMPHEAPAPQLRSIA
ncbi:aminotransferase class V-fold PLP-dependent enzyme [Geminicoccaceae bacterium 1502E]|nr:aminotransferase class V-fold PLP-dependent enzyme [Geminicoccaceae bacterium 1502E]